MTTDESTENQREFSRVRTRLVATLSKRDGADVTTTAVLDIALGGIGIEDATNLPVGTEVRVIIRPEDDPSAYAIEAIGTIVRSDERGGAIEFTELENRESLQHLRNLVLYNSESPEPVEDEFRRHKGISRKTSSPSS